MARVKTAPDNDDTAGVGSAPRLNYHRRGNGEPLLLIHGVGSQWQVWEPVLDALAARSEVVALDLPGFGDSPPLAAGQAPSVAALTDALVDFLDELGWERPHVAGNSLGGWLSLELARRGRARSATALSPAGFWTPREAAFCRQSLRTSHAVAQLLGERVRPIYATALGRTLLLSQVVARPWRMDPDAAVGAFLNLARSPGTIPTLERLTAEQFRPGPRIEVPVTIAWGQHDHLLLPRQARRAARALPEARVITMPGVGHVPFSDDPQLVAQTILEGGPGAA